MSRLDQYVRVEVDSAEAWRRWLEEHHQQSESVWLVTWKKGRGPHVPYDARVEEALCWGWVDGLARGLDEDRSMLLLSPRKPNSTWSRLNKERVERLIAEGRMQPAGLARIEVAKANGSWTVLDASEALSVPEDLARALDANPEARAKFDAFSPSSRKTILWYVASARREETRAQRISETVRLAAQGLRVGYPADKAAIAALRR